MYKIIKLNMINPIGRHEEFFIYHDGLYWRIDDKDEIKKLDNILFLSGIKLHKVKVEILCNYKKDKLNLFKDIPEKLNGLMKIDMSSDSDIFLPEEFNEYIWQFYIKEYPLP